eukprot:Skav217273  [mRNA]  locus=scaffold120:72069:79234:- [translate_table: standard]
MECLSWDAARDSQPELDREALCRAGVGSAAIDLRQELSLAREMPETRSESAEILEAALQVQTAEEKTQVAALAAEGVAEAAKCRPGWIEWMLGLTDIHVAAIDGNVAAVQHLLRADSFAAQRTNAFGSTPLHVAAYHGHLEIVRLLQSTSTVDLKNDLGR